IHEKGLKGVRIATKFQNAKVPKSPLQRSGDLISQKQSVKDEKILKIFMQAIPSLLPFHANAPS
ncbi:MAG: hypothetical protein LKK16_08115, partial [Bacteroidales bacterium]|nr:hypothetical protein [Bacteroidales bacterium]